MPLVELSLIQSSSGRGCERQSNWRVAGVAVAGLALVLVTFFVVILLLSGSTGK
jgi:hypothetical protein